MPVMYELLEQGRVIKIAMSDPVEDADVDVAAIEANQHAVSSEFTVHALVDVCGCHSLPGNVLRMRRHVNLSNPRPGYIIFLGASDILRTLLMITFRLANYHRVAFFDNEVDALDFLHKQIMVEVP